MSATSTSVDNEWPAARQRGSARARQFLGKLLREPVVHFLVLGILLFAVSEYLEERSRFTRIEITQAQIDAMRETYRLQYGAVPTQAQLDTLVDAFIKEEVFYHEAVRLNLDRDDEIVKRRLVQKYEFLLQDLTLAQTPSDVQLREFYRAHLGNYEAPAKVSFSHVFFATDRDGEQAAHRRAVHAVAQLRAGGRAAQPGDAFPGLSDYAAQSPTQVARIFGAGDFSEKIFGAPLGQWEGPYRSGYGWHVLQVNSIEPPQVAAYETVVDAVKRDYLDADRVRRNDEALQRLLKSFTIVRGAR